MEERTLFEGQYTGKKYKVGTVYDYQVSVPAHDRRGGCALMLEFDKLANATVESMAALNKSKKAPGYIGIGISGGSLPAQIKGGNPRGMRADSFDMYDREFSDFLVKEFIPFLVAEYHLHISKSPDMHVALGGSSGGIAAFQTAWFHPEYFHRVYMSSPSMLSMGRGEEFITLIRKCEPKPIKVYMEYSGSDLDEYVGNSAAVGEGVYRSLKFAGYDVICNVFPGEGHCSRYGNAEQRKEAFAWLWENLDTPIVPGQGGKQFGEVMPEGSRWEKTDEAFPLKIAMNVKGTLGSYVTRGGQILFLHKGGADIVARGLKSPTGLCVASDGAMLYYSDKNSGIVAAFPILADGTLGPRHIHGMIHTYGDFDFPGALDIAVDAGDRLFAATEVGAQCIRSFGLIDAILDNPDGLQVKRLAFAADGSPVLYAETARGVYKRAVLFGAPTGQTEPKTRSYFDWF